MRVNPMPLGVEIPNTALPDRTQIWKLTHAIGPTTPTGLAVTKPGGSSVPVSLTDASENVDRLTWTETTPRSAVPTADCKMLGHLQKSSPLSTVTQRQFYLLAGCVGR